MTSQANMSFWYFVLPLLILGHTHRYIHIYGDHVLLCQSHCVFAMYILSLMRA